MSRILSESLGVVCLCWATCPDDRRSLQHTYTYGERGCGVLDEEGVVRVAGRVRLSETECASVSVRVVGYAYTPI